MASIASVTESKAGSSAGALGAFIDEEGLTEEMVKRNPNRAKPHPFALYCRRVREQAGVPDAQETREMCSVICGEVAKLPFLPDFETEIEATDFLGNPIGTKTTEYEQQIKKTAARAEGALDSPMVWTASALKLARAALDIRKSDPDGSKGDAWVNDPLPGERAAA